MSSIASCRHRNGWIFAWLVVLLAGCRAAAPAPQPPLPGQSLPDEVTAPAPEEDPEEAVWTRETKKLKRNWQKMLGREPNEAAAQQLFAEGERLYRSRQYDEAASKFKLAAIRWPDSPLQEDALFLQAESYFFANRYPKASDTYGTLMKKFENSRYLERAVSRQFAIARYWDELDRFKHRWVINPNMNDKTRPLFDTQGNALAAYESVHLNDPTGPLADDAVLATANAHFLSGRYGDADHYYDMLRKQYPQSDYQRVAHLLGLRSKMRMYQGPHYEGQPLDQADELIQQTSAQFPDLPDDEKERLRTASRVLRAQRAQREFETAEYYAKTKHFGGARYYYQLVIREYPDSRYAELAQERLVKYQGRPDNPPQRFQWLVWIFDGPKRN